MRNLRVAIATFACLAVSPAWAAATDFCAAAQEIAFVRISTIKPTGSRAGFEEAARDHIKWYRDHGFTQNDQVVLNVIEVDPVTRAATVSKTKVMTIHYNPPRGVQVKQDADWDAYVAKYRANSDIVTEELACVPKRN